MPPAPATPPATPPVAPSTPAAPPVAPATPPSTPAAPPEGGESSFDKFDDQFKDLEDSPATPPSPPATAPAAPAKPTKGRTPPATPAPPATPPATTGEFEDVEGIQVPRFKKDGEFRNWGLNGYKKAKALEGEITQLRTKAQDLEQEYPKTKAEREALAAKLADVEKRLTERESEIKFLSYERSAEYRDKYETPYRNAVTAAYSEVKELTVTEADPNQPLDENGNRPTRERPATPADFDEIYSLPLGAAAKLANKNFGVESAPIILQHRKAIKDLASSANRALTDWKETSKKREEDQKNQATIQRGEIESQWSSINKRMSEDERGKDWWGQEKDDKDINEALAKGFAFADNRFSEDFNKLPPMEQIMLDASIRHRVAGFYRLRVEKARLKAENDQLKKDLAQARGSDPGAPATPAGGTPPVTESEGAMAEFDKKM